MMTGEKSHAEHPVFRPADRRRQGPAFCPQVSISVKDLTKPPISRKREDMVSTDNAEGKGAGYDVQV